MFDWDDLRPFLAVAQHGSTTAAARALGIDQSTVQRRLIELERCIGQALVQRSATGCRLTAYGEELLPFVQAVQRQVSLLDAKIGTSARGINGVLRLTCPEPIVLRITQSPLLDRLRERHPDLHVEFITTDRYVDLRRGDADVALRSGDTPNSDLIGRRVGESLWAVYAGRDYLAKYGPATSMAVAAQREWIALDASMADHRYAQWLRQTASGARIVATCNSILGLVQSTKSGLGLAALPTALGDAEPLLARQFGPVPELTRTWKMLTTRELRRTPRVASFFAFMVSESATLRPILGG